MQERTRSALSGTALAVYGGLAWLACLVVGTVLGLLIDGDPDDGTVQGASHGLVPALPEILISIAALLAAAYGLFFWLLLRRR